MNNILVTGAAGFIGFHLCQQLLSQGKTVIGIDNLNSYYDVNLKKNRLAQLQDYANFHFHKLDIVDRLVVAELFAYYQPEQVINLAGQPGVHYSLENPHAYVDSNLVGFMNILEGCRQEKVSHLVYASSSSVYGANKNTFFSTKDRADYPVSLYGATKKANELMAHAYSHLYSISTTGLRFFSVYGPWGRPDMAMFRFTKAILEGQSINVYNHGKMRRDFTYIDDVIDGVIKVLEQPPQKNTNSLKEQVDWEIIAPYRIYDIGNNKPVELLRFIEVLEDCLGMKTKKNLLPLQLGEVLETYADIQELTRDVGFKPSTPIEKGIPRFVDWYYSYYGVSATPNLTASNFIC
jgi:UDP-glucuronate 4-epimerase